MAPIKSLPTRTRRASGLRFALFSSTIGASILALVGTDIAAAQGIEEIVVTARKRSESLQDVPLSIVAFGLDTIEQQKISNLDDLARLTPGFTMDDGFGYLDARPAIRGQSNIRAASQPTVGVLIDGIDLPYRSGLNGETLDIERIEVVKGPQSALFGRGVLSGAINYVTRRPDLEAVGGYAEVEAATDDLYEIGARINAPLAKDVFGIALSARYSDFEGFFENNLTGAETVGGHEYKTVVGTALWQPSDAFTAYLRLSYSDELRELPQRHVVPSNTQTGAVASQVWFVGEVEADEDLISHNGDDYAGLDRQFKWASLDLEWDIGYGTISSITAFTNTEINNDQDSDYEGIPASDPAFPPFFNNLRQIIIRDIDTVSQELRYTSPAENRFRWLVGGYYYNQENTERGKSPTGIGTDPNDFPFTEQSDETETFAVFGQASFDITDQLTASAELRWNQDELSSNGTRDGQPFPLNETFESTTPRLTLEYQATADVLLYASAAKGTKPGGFNTALGAGTGTLPLELIAFDEESAWQYEIGFKASFLDDTLIVNGAYFYIDWTDVQIDDQFENPDGTTIGYTSNAGDASVSGFEVNLQWAATEMLDLSLGYSYNPARIDIVVDGTTDQRDSRAARAGIAYSGEQSLPFSSDHALTASARVHGTLGDGWDWYIQPDFRWDSSQYASTANLAETGDRYRTDLRAGIENETWSVQGYITNLFDSDDPASIQPFVNVRNFARVFLVTVPDPQQFGVRLRYKF